MNYSQIRYMDISNGPGIGISLFVQGCPIRCRNCFNPETWDFKGGKTWTQEIRNKFTALANRDYIHRVSILGGEPLAHENLSDISQLLETLKALYKETKAVWLYTGYTFEEFNEDQLKVMANIDVLVDGPYIHEQRDITLPYKGSTNQRVIDVQETLRKGQIVLWHN